MPTTETPTPTPTSGQLEQMAARRAQIDATIEALNEEKDAINGQFAKLDFGNHPAGDFTIMVQHNRRLNTSMLLEAYPVASNPQLYKPAADTAAVKKHIAPVELDKFYTEGAPKILVKL